MRDMGIGDKEEILRLAGADMHNSIKVNLRYEPGQNGEGVWAVPCSEADDAVYANDNTEERVFYVYLLNDPICPGLQWGSKLACYTNGQNRPYSVDIADDRTTYDAACSGLTARGARA